MDKELKDEFYKHLSGIDNISKQFIELYLKHRKDTDMERVLAALLGYEKRVFLKENGVGKYTETTPKILNDLPEDIADHTKTLLTRKGNFAVAEPYQLSLDDLKELIKFCDENNLGCAIDGDSVHFTGHTVRIKFYKKSDVERAIHIQEVVN